MFILQSEEADIARQRDKNHNHIASMGIKICTVNDILWS